ncbi:hypothetical protein MTO96_031226 [Rhipicephalus appendiculatus]
MRGGVLQRLFENMLLPPRGSVAGSPENSRPQSRLSAPGKESRPGVVLRSVRQRRLLELVGFPSPYYYASRRSSCRPAFSDRRSFCHLFFSVESGTPWTSADWHRGETRCARALSCLGDDVQHVNSAGPEEPLEI